MEEKAAAAGERRRSSGRQSSPSPRRRSSSIKPETERRRPSDKGPAIARSLTARSLPTIAAAGEVEDGPLAVEAPSPQTEEPGVKMDLQPEDMHREAVPPSEPAREERPEAGGELPPSRAEPRSPELPSEPTKGVEPEARPSLSGGRRRSSQEANVRQSLTRNEENPGGQGDAPTTEAEGQGAGEG